MRPSELIEQGWCVGALARDAKGKAVDPYDPKAQSWCYLGAVTKAISHNAELNMDYRSHMLRYLRDNDNSFTGNVLSWNDHAGSVDVVLNTMKAVEAAIDKSMPYPSYYDW